MNVRASLTSVDFMRTTAAWAEDLARTSLHGPHGAGYLRDVQHADPMLCRLVSIRRATPLILEAVGHVHARAASTR